MKPEKVNEIFIEGAITSSFIAEAIHKHSTKKDIGAHSIFLGQVRSDKIDEQVVAAIEYTAYREMAKDKFKKIREDAFDKFPLICLYIYHSLGRVEAGEISLFVFVSSVHRKDAIIACEEIVEKIKNEVPVWGKELFAGEGYQWKRNSS